ncbi:heme-dependent oxidative N-demethylase family protein [Geminicoccus harenae]|uniref:heme-dependent oxidative N-demethylase family protein n=1 Tax=Geminicoccus harenae TaxID=2498453 RepID=UPI00168B356C|nr:DUF3445 domain-containing protein [Geminicoccus harenae]
MNEALLPFLGGPWQLSMGLRRLEPDDWLVINAQHARQMRERERLLAERRGEVVAAVAGSEPACAEVLALLVEFLPRRFPERWQQADGALVDRLDERRIELGSEPPLVTAGRLVQEDLCVMRKGPEGYELAAAVLCFPSHWSLAEKVGQPMARIHAPVPGFDERLGPTADRFLAALTAERPVWRINWAISETDELFLPAHRARRPFDPEQPVERQLHLRIERQTLRRLQRSGDILFTIHTTVTPIGTAIAKSSHARALAERIREMPERMASYKGFHVMGPPLLAWLDRLAGDELPAGGPG